jgi:hypothetical protein
MYSDIIHYDLHTTEDVPKLLGKLREKFGGHSHLALVGSAKRLMGNHKIVTLRSFKGDVVRISGPDVIIEDFVFVYYTNHC